MMSPSQIRSAGLTALAKALGPTGMARFIQQFELGTGNYTQDRSPVPIPNTEVKLFEADGTWAFALEE